MSSSTFSVYISDPYGTRLSDALPFLTLDYTRVTGGVSAAVITLPESAARDLIRLPDGRLEIWRRLDNGREYLDTDTTWLIRKRERTRDDRGNVVTTLTAEHPLSILREPGRFVDNFAGTGRSSQAGAVDDIMKAIVRQQAGTQAGTARNLSPYLTVAPDMGMGPAIARSFAWRAVLDVLQDLADDAAQQGAYVTFDIVSLDTQGYEFRTYVGQRGVDRRAGSSLQPLILSPEFGNLGSTTLIEDYTEEITYAKYGGAGERSARITADYLDTIRAGASPFGRREYWGENTQTADTTVLTGQARSAVRTGRARLLFTGTLIDTPDTRYGVQWQWGDYVTAQDFGAGFDCRIDAVSVSVAGGEERISASLRAELAL